MAETIQKIPTDGVGYITDIHDIVSRELKTQMKPFVTAVMMNNEEVLRGQKKQNQFLQKTVNHDTWIKALGAGQVLTMLAVFLSWIIG